MTDEAINSYRSHSLQFFAIVLFSLVLFEQPDEANKLFGIDFLTLILIPSLMGLFRDR